MQNDVRGVVSWVRGSYLLRLFLIGFLVLLLLIPALMISGLVYERRARRDEAVNEVRGKWGGLQIVTGPALVIPYVNKVIETTEKGEKVVRSRPGRLTVLPETLNVAGRIETEVRHRGIFTVPVYKMTLDVGGRFARPDLSEYNIQPDGIRWDRAEIGVGIADARAIQEHADLRWNDRAISFLPGTDQFDVAQEGIHAPLGGGVFPATAEFSFHLVLNGSEGAYFVPFGKETRVGLESNWPSPSFQGNWLPKDRNVGDSGFEAVWTIPFLGRNYPQGWTSEGRMTDTVAASKFGLDLMAPVDEYRMAERSVKYAGLFILLTFGTLWMIEILGGVRVHSIQYLLVGAALCVFYLLELALSEHLGFTPAYMLAAAAVVGLVSSYSLAALRSPGRAATVGGLVTALYAYLYVLLKNEDYALLIGSIGLFLMLAVVMYLTRRIDWHGGAGDPKLHDVSTTRRAS